MIDFAIAAALGAIAVALLALAALPVIWRLAKRVSRQRLEAELPLSASEVRAGRDLVRAEAALALNRAEQRIGRERTRRADLLADIARASAEIRTLDAELDEARALAESRGAEVKRLHGHEAEIAAAREEVARIAARLQEQERQRDAAEEAVHGHRIELAARGTRLGVLEDRLDEAARQLRELTEAAVERDGQIALQRIELGRRETALQAAEMRLVTQDRRVAELQTALERARVEREAWARVERDAEEVRAAIRQVALDIARQATAPK